jgi:hypothetical protein
MLTFKKIHAELLTERGPAPSWTWRAKIPGGWLVGRPDAEHMLTFVPDPGHAWDGNSLP